MHSFNNRKLLTKNERRLSRICERARERKKEKPEQAKIRFFPLVVNLSLLGLTKHTYGKLCTCVSEGKKQARPDAADRVSTYVCPCSGKNTWICIESLSTIFCHRISNINFGYISTPVKEKERKNAHSQDQNSLTHTQGRYGLENDTNLFWAFRFRFELHGKRLARLKLSLKFDVHIS